MYSRFNIPPVIIIMILFLMSLDAQILATVVCIPTGILMLSHAGSQGKTIQKPQRNMTRSPL